jgi:hypothetical protein
MNPMAIAPKHAATPWEGDHEARYATVIPANRPTMTPLWALVSRTRKVTAPGGGRERSST